MAARKPVVKTVKRRPRATTPSAPFFAIPPYLSLTFLIGFLLFYVGLAPLFMDPDTPWHIAAGQLIRQLGHVPTTDPWSYASTQGVWYNLSWAWDVVIGCIHDWLGPNALFLFTCLWDAGVITLLAWVLYRRMGVINDALLMVVALAALTLIIQLGTRPQMMTEMMALVFLHLVYTSQKNRSGLLFCLLPVLMMVWANFHGGYLAGFAVLGCYSLEAASRKDKEWLYWLLWVTLLCVPASLITPLGAETFHATLRTLSSVIAVYIMEWGPMQFNISMGFNLFLMAIIVSSGFRQRDIPLAEKLLAGLWLFAAFNSMRHLFLAVLLGAPYLARSLTSFLPHIKTYRFDAPALNKALLLGIALTLPIAALFPIRELMDRPRVMSNDIVPMEALAYMRKHYPGKRFLNEFYLGGYMIYFNRDVQQVFSDGRAGTVYSEADLKELIDLINNRNTEKIFRKYNFDGVFIKPRHRIFLLEEIHDTSRWKKTFDDGNFAIYMRRSLTEGP